jgi:hypothetical protein
MFLPFDRHHGAAVRIAMPKLDDRLGSYCRDSCRARFALLLLAYGPRDGAILFWQKGKTVRIKLEGAPPFELPMIQNSTVSLKGEDVEMVLHVLAGNKLVPIHAPMTFQTADALALQLVTAAFRAKTSQK